MNDWIVLECITFTRQVYVQNKTIIQEIMLRKFMHQSEKVMI